MIVVDTSVWVDYFNGVGSPAADRLDGLFGRDTIILGDVILTEILQGFRNDRDAAAAVALLRHLPFVSMIGWAIAVKSAENYRALRARGITVRKTVDLWIGTYCIEHCFPLLHNDRDFGPMQEHLGLMPA
jgi:hypothetical protein